jgi:hypothetical protein
MNIPGVATSPPKFNEIDFKPLIDKASKRLHGCKRKNGTRAGRDGEWYYQAKRPRGD